MGDNEGVFDFDDEAGGANEDEQLQMDGWLYIAPQIECLQFRVGSSANPTRARPPAQVFGNRNINLESILKQPRNVRYKIFEKLRFWMKITTNSGEFCLQP